MPRLMATNDDQVISIPGPGSFQFSAIRLEDLGASEYTLVTIVCDISGSVSPFAAGLLKCIKSIVGACQKSPRSENLLLRLLVFNYTVMEIHGFKNLDTIDLDAYDPLKPDGMTALVDATYDAIGATLEFSKTLKQNDYDDVNGIVFIITDGLDNRSNLYPKDIAEKVAIGKKSEIIVELKTILVGLNEPGNPDPEVTRGLSTFQVKGKIDQFIDLGDATPEALAKLANFASGSISSASEAIASGTPSQQLTI